MRVIIESPYKAVHFNGQSLFDNIEYAKDCLSNSLSRGESPFVSHLLYTQVLDDDVPDERQLGMNSALEWYEVADLCAVYIDLGISEGMASGIKHAKSLGLIVEERTIHNGRI
tara:strand:+ start:519 stop:857 length:339 start_codon:yes stop_codon:yes gene_type:complete